MECRTGLTPPPSTYRNPVREFEPPSFFFQKFVDELGRWATGAANVKKSNCGQRYSVAANQALQLHLRGRICEVLVSLRSEMPVGEEGLIPSFASLAVSETLRSHLFFGPQGVGYVPSRR